MCSHSAQAALKNNAVKNNNQTQTHDQPFHSWYQFVLGFPPHLVRTYIEKFGAQPRNHLVLDPFCGTGTTNVECKKLGIDSLGLEANTMAHFASLVKTTWDLPLAETSEALNFVTSLAHHSLDYFGLPENSSFFVQRRKVNPVKTEPKLSDDQIRIIPTGFISPVPLRRVLILKACIDELENKLIKNLFYLALANLIVNHAGNVGFGPEVYATKPKKDIPILDLFYHGVNGMIHDIKSKPQSSALSEIVYGDARNVPIFFRGWSGKVNFVITSPPYPNEKDYTRTTRLESVILGFLSNKEDLRSLKHQLMRSNSRNIFVGDNDADFVKDFDSINRIAQEIEDKRIILGKTSGFERLYHKIVKHYFGGMYRHLQSLKCMLSPNAQLAYVVGDQMSFFRINIPTAKILAEIGEAVGYKVDGIDLWRTRLSTATRLQIDENVLLLRS